MRAHSFDRHCMHLINYRSQSCKHFGCRNWCKKLVCFTNMGESVYSTHIRVRISHSRSNPLRSCSPLRSHTLRSCTLRSHTLRSHTLRSHTSRSHTLRSHTLRSCALRSCTFKSHTLRSRTLRIRT